MTPQDLIARATLPSPLGPLTAAATSRGIARLWFDTPARAGLEAVPEQPGQRWLGLEVRRTSQADDHATVERCILFDDVHVGAGAQLRNCLVDKGVQIPPGAKIGFEPARDRELFTVSEGGVVVVPQGWQPL